MLVQLSSPTSQVYCHIIQICPLPLAVVTGRPHLHTEFVPSQIWSVLFSFLTLFFIFFPFLLNALLTQKPCLPVALEESHCNEKRRSSINTTTCSAGTISYLLLNDLIGSEQGRKGVGRLFSWFWCGGAKCFPLRRFWTLLFVFVGILMGLNITGCIISFQCRNPTESFWKWALYHLPSHIPLQLSLFFIKTSTFIKFLC